MNRCGDKDRNGVERAATFACTARSRRAPSSRTWQSGGSEPEEPGTWRISHTASSPSSPPQHRTVQRGYTHHSICAPNTPSPRSAPRIAPAPSYTSSISFSSVKQTIPFNTLIVINFIQFNWRNTAFTCVKIFHLADWKNHVWFYHLKNSFDMYNHIDASKISL